LPACGHERPVRFRVHPRDPGSGPGSARCAAADGCAPYPGRIVTIRLLGVIEAEQDDEGESVRDDRLVGLAEGSTEHGSPGQLKDLDGELLDQIEAFFSEDNRLRGRRFEPIGRRGPRAARRLIEKARIG
jgi:inorganic pyrophosphatase